MENGISIIICTYNGKRRLERTLEHINKQVFRCFLEIVFIDNASTDGTQEFVDNWWKENGNTLIGYRSFFQPKPGKSFALELGYINANAKYLLICDDDNWLTPKYVQTAYEIMESRYDIGALGGWCEGVFEIEQPLWFTNYSKYFAVSKQGKKSGDITNEKGCLYGAGMVIRKRHWVYLNQIGFQPLLTCRTGNTLSSGGDTEYSYALRLLGYKIWYDERLYFQHYMPKERLSLGYVKRIRKAISKSNFVLKGYLDRLGGQMDTRKVFLQNFKYQLRYSLKSNIKKSLIGTFEEREEAKEFYRGLKRNIFNYNEYKKNYEKINLWVNSAKRPQL